MKGATLKVSDLLKVVKKNRDEHVGLLEKAKVGYKKAVIKKLNEMIEDVHNNEEFSLFIGVTEPQDHTNDYDRVVEMLQMTTASAVELDQSEFERYVRNRWEWSEFANMTNTMYASENFQ